MGVLQMAESELSGNTKPKGQEESRKASTQSSQSPKTSQPSCLRGAFIRLFAKRTEPNNRAEEDPTSIQNTEDPEGVRGKKRRVAGSIFRLPCLRPAETTANDIKDKTEDQSSDVVQEEELKPYSKASFLRKIRCYRLMREKDATEKEKVIEMSQRKYDRENAEVKQYKGQERVLEQSEEGLQCITHGEVVVLKGKDTTEQECQVESLGEAGNDFLEQVFDEEHVGEQENSLTKQECCTGKLRELEEIIQIEDPSQGLGGMGRDLVKNESFVETLKEKGALPEGEGSLLKTPAEKNLAEQESQREKVEKMENVLDAVTEQKEGVIEPNNYSTKVGDLDNALSDNIGQPEVVRKQEEHMSNQEEGALEKDLPGQEGDGIMITNTEESLGAIQKCFPENKCDTDELGDAGKYLGVEEGHAEKVGNTENNLSGQQGLENDMEDTRNYLSELGGQIDMRGLEEKARTEWDSQGDIAHKMDNDVLDKDSHGEEESHVEIGGDQEKDLVDQESHAEKVENTWKDISEQDSQYTQAETVGECEDNSTEVSGISLGAQNKQNFTNNSNQGLTITILNQESVTSETCLPQDPSAKRTLGSENNEELVASVKKKSTANNTSPSSEEAHTHVLGLQKEVLTSTNTMDLTYQNHDILHACVNNEDDGEESPDLGSLRVEVKDMVEWMVQEASDRLAHYTQESEGTE
ncbi:uncharacterized protein LOC142658852 isoform X2 [Rhinoderma darwinii]